MPQLVPSMAHEVRGSGESLVLVPGGLTGWLSWESIARKLATSRRVVRVQLHNVALGLSGAPLPADYSIGYEVHGLRAALDEIGIDRADVAGWSYGAVIALSFALHHPERLRTLTLIEPSPFWVLRSRGAFSPEVRAEQAFFATLATEEISEDQMVSFARFAGLLPEGGDPRSLPQWPTWFEHRRSLRIGDIEYRHKDSMSLVRAFPKPVLLVKGEGSNPHVHEIADILAAEFPDARAVTFPGGHAPHLETTEPFLERFREFLRERNGAGRRTDAAATNRRNLMSTRANKEVVRRFNEEFISRGDMNAFDELLAADVIDHNVMPGFPPGAEGVKKLFFEVYRSAFPDLWVEIYDQVAEGDKVVTRKAFHGTHLGPLMGISPSGKRVKIDVIDIVRVVNGQIVEHWNVVDQMGLMQQLGVAPVPH